MPSNPIALIGAALKLGEDGAALYKDIKGHDKAAAVAAAKDALPALATLTGQSLSDLQAVLTDDNLGMAYDLEQDVESIVPLVKGAIDKYRTVPPQA